METPSSTDVFAVDDPVIVQALKYIRQNSDKPLQVSDISSHVNVSKLCLRQTILSTPAGESIA